MKTLILMALLLASSFANAYNCRYSAEGTNSNFAGDKLYRQAPKIVTTPSCATEAPTCVGFAYCEDRGLPPQVIQMACKAIGTAGNWHCPNAEVCGGDDDVQIDSILHAASTGQLPGGTEEGVKK